jgi:hypothetical protein
MPGRREGKLHDQMEQETHGTVMSFLQFNISHPLGDEIRKGGKFSSTFNDDVSIADVM